MRIDGRQFQDLNIVDDNWDLCAREIADAAKAERVARVQPLIPEFPRSRIVGLLAQNRMESRFSAQIGLQGSPRDLSGTGSRTRYQVFPSSGTA